MATCSFCGTTILFGGVKEGDARYCNATCQLKAGPTNTFLATAQAVPDDQVREAALEIQRGPCPKCTGKGPVDVHVAHFVWSALVLTSWSSKPEISCRSCGVKRQLLAFVGTGLVGWWGFPWGLVMTPVQLVRNVGGMIAGGKPGPSPQLHSMARQKLAIAGVGPRVAAAATLPAPSQNIAVGIVASIFAVGLLVVGGVELWNAWSNPEPTVMTVTDFVNARSRPSWVHLAGAEISIPSGVYIKKPGGVGAITEVYFPVHVADSDAGPAHIVLATRETDLIWRFRETLTWKNEAQAREMIDKDPDKYFPRRPVKGLVRTGIAKDGKIEQALSSVSGRTLAKGYVIIDDGKSPGFVFGLVLLIGGLALVGLVARGWMMRRKRINELKAAGL